MNLDLRITLLELLELPSSLIGIRMLPEGIVDRFLCWDSSKLGRKERSPGMVYLREQLITTANLESERLTTTSLLYNPEAFSVDGD